MHSSAPSLRIDGLKMLNFSNRSDSDRSSDMIPRTGWRLRSPETSQQHGLNMTPVSTAEGTDCGCSRAFAISKSTSGTGARGVRSDLYWDV